MIFLKFKIKLLLIITKLSNLAGVAWVVPARLNLNNPNRRESFDKGCQQKNFGHVLLSGFLKQPIQPFWMCNNCTLDRGRLQQKVQVSKSSVSVWLKAHHNVWINLQKKLLDATFSTPKILHSIGSLTSIWRFQRLRFDRMCVWGTFPWSPPMIFLLGFPFFTSLARDFHCSSSDSDLDECLLKEEVF